MKQSLRICGLLLVAWATAAQTLALPPPPDAGAFSFVQISDTHVGFKGQANSDATATLRQVVERINALQPAPASRERFP